MLFAVLLAVLLPLQTLAVECEKKGVYLECSNLNVDQLVEKYENEQVLKLTNLTGLSAWNSSKLSAVNTVSIYGGVLAKEAIQSLVKLTHLSSLEISDVDGLTIETADFPLAPNLHRLKIENGHNVSLNVDLPVLYDVELIQSDFVYRPRLSKSVTFLNASGSQGMYPIPDSISLEEIDCSFCQLTLIDFDSNAPLAASLEKLWISNNRLSTFVATLPSLSFLHLEHNKLTVLDSKMFKNLPSLADLFLAHNQISQIQRPFSGNKNLKFLDLSDNRLTEISADIFEPITELEILRLDGNRIKTLPDLSIDLYNLHRLDLPGNQLISLNEEFFRHVPELAYLNVSNNNLRHINNVAQFFGNLNRFIASGNQLRFDADTFHLMDALFYLDLSNNGLKNTLTDFKNTPSLRHLYLNNNNITELCDGKTAPTFIEYLFLKNNQISSLRCLTKVRYLDVENNPLECTNELKAKLIELADSTEILALPSDLVEVFNHSELELVDGGETFRKLCPDFTTSSSTTAKPETTASLPVTPVAPVEKPEIPDYYEGDEVDDSYTEKEIIQSEKDSIFGIDSNLSFIYHGRQSNRLAAFALFLSVALGIVLITILVAYICIKIRERRNANLGSDRPYKQLKNDVYKSTTAGIDNGRNIANVFSKFRNDKLDEIMIKFGFKWNNGGDVESEARMIPA